jgi:hypothetical protein
MRLLSGAARAVINANRSREQLAHQHRLYPYRIHALRLSSFAFFDAHARTDLVAIELKFEHLPPPCSPWLLTVPS